jgi:hypothetical protein
MNNQIKNFKKLIYLLCVLVLLISCKKFEKYRTEPELETLKQGIRTTSAVAYCASIAAAVYKGQQVPDNVSFIGNSGLIHVQIDKAHPLPFNNNIGDIVIAGVWHGNSGVISILFADIDVLDGDIDLYGLNTVPIIEDNETGDIIAVFAQQDIILGYGSDTILNTDHISDAYFNSEMERLDAERPSDVFVAVKQNVWFLDIDQANTWSDVYDDDIIINGGGQIAEIQGESGGILYHAMIDTKINFSECSRNPLRGTALSQNFKSGNDIVVDLGNTLLSFHDECDGTVHVDFASGKYVFYNGKDVSLDLE